MIEDIHNTSKLVVLDWQTALKLCKRPSSLVSVLLFFCPNRSLSRRPLGAGITYSSVGAASSDVRWWLGPLRLCDRREGATGFPVIRTLHRRGMYSLHCASKSLRCILFCPKHIFFFVELVILFKNQDNTFLCLSHFVRKAREPTPQHNRLVSAVIQVSFTWLRLAGGTWPLDLWSGSGSSCSSLAGYLVALVGPRSVPRSTFRFMPHCSPSFVSCLELF